ncbi:hypothetical protein PR048_011014 [Dryococelus australis]|uniref:Uncharacterized protein n=1 Tax=Dryococelus australis TaxID=614101 RepID=A0ABQ9HKD6_9NEOP|nr:hypothetical protein PR048_011014 [Dryococelus australis]
MHHGNGVIVCTSSIVIQYKIRSFSWNFQLSVVHNLISKFLSFSQAILDLQKSCLRFNYVSESPIDLIPQSYTVAKTRLETC